MDVEQTVDWHVSRAMEKRSLHAHITRQSRDCDGEYRSGHVAMLTFEEEADTFGDLRFKERVLASVVTLHGYGTLTVTPSGVGWHEQTEEGYSAAEVLWCGDTCATASPWQRDLSAERAGY